MGLLLVGVAIFLMIWFSSLPATMDQRKGRQMYDEARRTQDAEFREQAKQSDSYYRADLFGVNHDFYSDGSLRRDATTGRSFSKGQYYCRADGITADYKKAGADMPRPPK